MDGASSEQKLAANPIMRSELRNENCDLKNTVAAPGAVGDQVNVPAGKARETGERLSKKANIGIGGVSIAEFAETNFTPCSTR